MFRVLVACSRDFSDYDLLKQKCDFMLQRHKDVEICCVTEKNSTKLIIEYAKPHKLFVKQTDWNSWGQQATIIAYQELADIVDAAIVFWNGEFYNEMKLIEYLKNLPRKHVVYKYESVKAQLERAKQELKASPKRKKITVPLSKEAKQRYLDAHKKWYCREYPLAVADGLYTPPKMFPINSGSAMDKFIVNFIIWDGWSATKISVLQKSGNNFIRTGAGIGTFDISATINGRSVKLETKHCSDTPSDDQLKIQARERRSGAIAEFVHSIDEFFELYDRISE